METQAPLAPRDQTSSRDGESAPGLGQARGGLLQTEPSGCLQKQAVAIPRHPLLRAAWGWAWGQRAKRVRVWRGGGGLHLSAEIPHSTRAGNSVTSLSCAATHSTSPQNLPTTPPANLVPIKSHQIYFPSPNHRTSTFRDQPALGVSWN